MISNFSEYDDSDPLIAYLMDTNDVKVPEEDLLKEKRRELGGSKSSELKIENTGYKNYKEVLGYNASHE